MYYLVMAGIVGVFVAGVAGLIFGKEIGQAVFIVSVIAGWIGFELWDRSVESIRHPSDSTPPRKPPPD